MDCPECERLRSERDAAEQRYGHAESLLEVSDLASSHYRERLRIELTEAKLYLDMAGGEIVRHQTLAHTNSRGAAVMTACASGQH
jgi:hypothetical protein